MLQGVRVRSSRRDSCRHQRGRIDLDAAGPRYGHVRGHVLRDARRRRARLARVVLHTRSHGVPRRHAGMLLHRSRVRKTWRHACHHFRVGRLSTAWISTFASLIATRSCAFLSFSVRDPESGGRRPLVAKTMNDFTLALIGCVVDCRRCDGVAGPSSSSDRRREERRRAKQVESKSNAQTPKYRALDREMPEDSFPRSSPKNFSTDYFFLIFSSTFSPRFSSPSHDQIGVPPATMGSRLRLFYSKSIETG